VIHVAALPHFGNHQVMLSIRLPGLHPDPASARAENEQEMQALREALLSLLDRQAEEPC
jgi:hypothetical protein